MWAVLVLQNIITLSVNLADNIMLGGYSETSLAGVAAVNQIQFVYQQVLLALGEGIVIIGTQYLGKGITDAAGKILATAMRTALILAVLLFCSVSLWPHNMLLAFTPDEAIIGEGAKYLFIIRFTYIFFAITQILIAFLRSTGRVNIALALSLWTFAVNCCINYTLIYGHFGAPSMGVRGAAIGTLVSRMTELIILLIYILVNNRSIKLSLKTFIKREPVLSRDYFKVIIPVVAVSGLWGLNNAVQNMILGHLDSHAIAANSVASTMFLLVKSMAVGTASTASFFIGKTIGEGDRVKLKEYARTLQILFVMVGLVAGSLLFAIRVPVLSLYKLESATWDMANTFLIILSLVMVGMSYQMPTNIGIIRGGGNTKYVMIMDIISIWIIVIPVSLLAAFYFNASPVIVLCCLNADQVFKCVPAFIMANFGNWVRVLTR